MTASTSRLELPDRATRHAIARRFPSISQRCYVRAKLGSDPVYAATAGVCATAPRLPLLDVGCGMGLLGHFLHACQMLDEYHGLDHDARKITAGHVAAASLDGALDLQHGDVTDLPDCHGHVALLDVLHYLPARRQTDLLTRLTGHVAPGGRLIIRNVLREPHWRFRATVIEEHVLSASGWMRVGATHYPCAEEIRAPLEAAGLKVTIAPLWGRTPFNSYLVVAHRH
ncbi:MAG TPA: class I SAM-dependent methyltransferase [Rhodanobacteraceae bacterium]